MSGTSMYEGNQRAHKKGNQCFIEDFCFHCLVFETEWRIFQFWCEIFKLFKKKPNFMSAIKTFQEVAKVLNGLSTAAVSARSEVSKLLTVLEGSDIITDSKPKDTYLYRNCTNHIYRSCAGSGSILLRHSCRGCFSSCLLSCCLP